MTIEEDQIKELNSRVMVKLAPSNISGIGVVAIRNIHRGEKMHCEPSFKRKFYTVPLERFNELNEEVGTLIKERWPSVVNLAYFQSPHDDAWPVLFMNHSEDPNYNWKTDCAIRDIQKGEEVTENYKLMKNYEKVHSFLCK